MNPGQATGIAGTGVVARALGRALREAGESVVAVAGRDAGRAAGAAAAIGGGTRALAFDALPAAAGRILIAVSDDAIAEVAAALGAAGLAGGLALHTSGAAGLAPLAPLRARGVACGVFHPLQTIPSAGDAGGLQGAAFGIAGDPAAVAWADGLAARLGGWPLHLDEAGLAAYHAAAVLAGNGAIALADAAAALMADAGVAREAALRALGPLGRASAANAFARGPEAALTGPIARGDAGTVRAHLAALASAPASVASLYKAVGRQLLDLARRRGLPEARARELAALLDEDTGGAR